MSQEIKMELKNKEVKNYMGHLYGDGLILTIDSVVIEISIERDIVTILTNTTNTPEVANKKIYISLKRDEANKIP